MSEGIDRRLSPSLPHTSRKRHHATPPPPRFPKFNRNDPWYDLESYMNWETTKDGGTSWNTRGWTVAQGDGLFMHVDPTKW